MSSLTYPYLTLDVMLEEESPDFIPDFFLQALSPVTSKFAYLGYEMNGDTTNGSFTLNLYCVEEMVLDLPLVDGLALVFGSGEISITIDYSTAEDAEPLTVTVLTGLAKLRFPRTWLTPVITDADGHYIADPVETHYTELVFEAGFSINSQWDVTPIWPGSSATGFDLPISMVGTSGVIISASDIVLMLSDSVELPDTAPALGDDWRGVFIASAAISYTKDLAKAIPDTLSFENCYLGTGGFTGEVTASWTDGLDAKLADMTFTLKSVNISFVQNVVTAGGFTGTVEIPYFQVEDPDHAGQTIDLSLDVVVSIGQGGDFSVAVSGTDGADIAEFDLATFGTVSLTSVGFGSTDDLGYVELGGTLALGTVAGVDLPDLSIDKVRILSDGTVSMDGGGITLQQTKPLDFHGFTIDITSAGYGIDEDGRNWVSLSGGITLCEGLPVGVSAKGLRVSWNPDSTDLSSVEFSCEGIGVDFTIPDTLVFSGDISYTETEQDGLTLHQFEGDIDLQIIPADLRITAHLIIGEGTADNGDTFKYFYFETDCMLPTGIPLGSTGVALYGFSGMAAYNMIPRPVDDSDVTIDWLGGEDVNWFTDWYLRDTQWQAYYDSQNPGNACFGLGVGTTIGTYADNGYTFASKVAFMISFPGPLVMLQGTGNLLKKRTQLDPDSPENNLFASLIVFDGSAMTILAALSMTYSLPAADPDNPDSSAMVGSILKAQASSEAFFDFDDPSNWHIYMGEKADDKRIRATVFSLLEANSYLMLDNSSFQAGSQIGIDKSYDYEIAAIVLKAILEGNASITWAPQHLEGDLSFEGELTLSAFGIELGLSVSAGVEGSTPYPREVKIHASVTFNMPAPIDDIVFEVELEWSKANTPKAISPILSGMQIREYKTGDGWDLSLYDTDRSDFMSLVSSATPVPLDARVVLGFHRNVTDSTGVAVIPPNTASPQVVAGSSFTYELSKLTLSFWDTSAGSGAGAWVVDSDLTAYWQQTGDDAGNLLELYGDGPFSYARNSVTGSAPVASDGGTPAGTQAAPWPALMDTLLAKNPDFPIDTSGDEISFKGYSVGDIGASASFSHAVVTASDPVGAPTDLYVQEPTSGVLGLYTTKYSGPVIEVNFTEPVQLYDIGMYALSAGSGLTARLTRADGTSFTLAWRPSSGTLQRYDFADDVIDIVKLELMGSGITKDSKGATCFTGLRYIAMSALDDADDMVSSGGVMTTDSRTTALADTYYRVYAEVQIDGAATNYYAYFKTDGPPEDLAPYVDRVIMANDGFPHYGLYNIDIVFNENYLDDIYGSNLRLEITDVNGAVVQSSDYLSNWDHTGSSTLQYYLMAWLGSLADMSGNTFTPVNDATPNILYNGSGSNSPLPANTALTAKLQYYPDLTDASSAITTWSRQLVTSQYASFSDLVSNLRSAAWVQALSSSADLAFDSSADFDTAYFEKLGLTTASLPDTPEVTALYDTTGVLRGLYLASPEPIDWSRVTLALSDSGGAAISYQVIAHPDSSRYLLVNAPSGSLSAWTDTSYEFDFSYDPGVGDSTLHRYDPDSSSIMTASLEHPAAVTITISEV